MGVLLLAPVVVVAILSLLAILRRPPTIPGRDPEQLRTVVDWRSAPMHDVGGDTHELLRQLVGSLAERRFILASTIERDAKDPRAILDVRERRLEVRVRPYGAGRWLLWVNEAGNAPEDSDDLRQLLTGLYRTLEERRGEGTRWHRREELAGAESDGAPSPFYVA